MAQPSASHASAMDSLGRGTTIMIIGTLALLLLSLLGRVATARHLSLEAFGDFNLGLAFAGLLSLVALLGLHQAVARTIAERSDPAVRRKLIQWTAVVTSAAAVVTSSLVYLFATQIAWLFDRGNPGELTPVFQLFSVTIGLTLLCTFIASVFQGFEDTRPNAWIVQGVQPGAFLVFVLIFFDFHLELTGALVAWVISNIVTFAVLVVYAWRHLPARLPDVPPAKSLPEGLWSLSLSLWGVTTLVYVTGYFDTLVLGAFWPESQVGIYSAVLTIGRLILVAANAVTYIFLPVAARLTGQGNIPTIRATYITTGRWIMIFTTPMFFVFGLLPGDSLTVIFGTPYAAGSLALIIVTVAALGSVFVGPTNAALAGMGMTRPLLIATVISGATNIVLSITLIPTFGLIGAAVAWSVARVAYPVAGAFSLESTHGVGSLRRSFLLPLAMSLGIGIPLFLLVGYLPHPDWVVFPMYFVGVGIFVGSIFATRTVEEGDFVICHLIERVMGRPLPKLRHLMERFSSNPPIE